MLATVSYALVDASRHLRSQRGDAATVEPGKFDGKRRQMISAHAIEYDHVKRRRRGPLLVEAAHVEARRIGPTMHELMNGVLVAVERENHRLVAREQRGESR